MHLMIAAAPFFAFPSFETLRFATLLRMRWKTEQPIKHSQPLSAAKDLTDRPKTLLKPGVLRCAQDDKGGRLRRRQVDRQPDADSVLGVAEQRVEAADR